MTRLGFPFQPSTSGRSATVDYGSKVHIRQMHELLVLTLFGERAMRPDLGSPVPQMLFGAGEGPAAAALGATLHATISQWLGHLVEVQDLTVAFVDPEGVLDIQITYRILATANDDQLSLRTNAS